jgi:C4-dicarboxylate-specific signal transduction histidine kinase
VIGRLRKLFEKGEHHEELINLDDLITSTLQLLRSELTTNNILVRTELKAGLPAISGDWVELQQVLVNLMMNAIDAMASVPRSARTLSIVTTATKEGNIEVSIRDRGPGMPEDQLKQIFEPFFTTKKSGLGLGLSICSTIIAAHRGQITLRNALGGGMVATVSLPRSAQLAKVS